jgi:DNA repair exonuclease SbcCD nuclease subunit
MKIGVIGDIHLRGVDPLGVINKEGINSRLVDKLDCLTFCVRECLKYNVEMVEFLGDVFDAINPTERIRGMFWECIYPLTSKGIPTRIILGNHDMNGQIYNLESERFVARPNIRIIRSETFYERIGDTQIAHIPYIEDKTTLVNVLKNQNTLKSRILFGHCEISGAALGADNHKMRSEIDAKFFLNELTLLGHIHKFQEIRPNLVYLGSITKADFGERNDRCAMAIVDTDSMTTHYIDIPQRPMLQIEIHENNPNNIYNAETIPNDVDVEGALLKVVFVGSTAWIRTLNRNKFRPRFKNVLKVMWEDRRLDVSIPTKSKKTSMEERVREYAAEKEFDSETLDVGISIVKDVESICI